MNKRFYVMDCAYSNYAKVIPHDNDSKTITCLICGSNIVTRESLLKLKFKGKRKADFYSAHNYHVISNEFQRVFRDSGISGVEFMPIDITEWVDGKNKSVPFIDGVYKELVIHGRTGFLRDLNGDVVEKCEKCNIWDYSTSLELEGLSVADDEWDGSDIFYFSNWISVIIVTEKLKDIIKHAGMSNCEFTPLDTFTFDLF